MNLWPSRLPYREGDNIPPGYRVESRPATGTLLAGSVILGSAYLVALLSDLDGGDRTAANWLLVPGIGPFGAMAELRVVCPEVSVTLEVSEIQNMLQNTCVDEVTNKAKTMGWLLADGLVQLAGASVLIVGLFSGDEELVRDVPQVTPVAGKDGYAIRWSGTF